MTRWADIHLRFNYRECGVVQMDHPLLADPAA
jgi:hypothetical protein